MNRKILNVAVLTLSIVLLSSLPRAGAVKVSIIVSEDAYVISDQADENRGNTLHLFVKNETELFGTRAFDAWLKFNLSAVPANVTINSAVLRMRTGLSGTGRVRVGVFTSNDTSWSEHTITWNTTPPLSSADPITILNVSTSNADYDFSVESTIKGGEIVCFVLKILLETATGGGQADFFSKESDSPPQLVVDYAPENAFSDWNLLIVAAASLIVIPIALGACLYRRVQRTPKTKA